MVLNDQAFIESSPSLKNRLIGLYRKRSVIRPDNAWLMGWYVLLVIIFLYYLIEMGLLMAFGTTFWDF